MFFSTIILYSICALLLFRIFKWTKSHARNYQLVQKLRGPPRTNIIVGNVTYIRGAPERAFVALRELARKYYPIYKLFAVHKGCANILTPEDCELILGNSVHNEKGNIYKLLHRWLRFGLLTSRGTRWQTRRRILTPAFHFNILQDFILVFNEEAEKLVKELEKECKKPFIDVNKHITEFTLKTIAETAMGTKLKFDNNEEQSYKQAILDVGEILLFRLTHPWCVEEGGNFLGNPRYFEEVKKTKILHKFTREVIQEREKNFKDTDAPTEQHDVYKKKKRLAMLDLLLSAKRNERSIDDKGIQEEVDTFMFEGHDTTAVALGFTLMLLANDKRAQENILKEMGDVLGDIHKKPTYSDLQNLKYMERCIKESLRLYPSVHLIARTLGQDIKSHSGHVLPKGLMAVIHIYDVHRNPEIYPEPEKFDPDRFLPENCQNRHPYAYLPFSAGPRNCIGQRFAMLEMKAALCAVLSSFVLEPVDTPETVVLVLDIVLRTKEGIKVRFVPRQKECD